MFKKLMVILFTVALFACAKIPGDDSEAVSAESLEGAAKINAHLAMAYFNQGNVSRAKQKLVLATEQAPNLSEVHIATAYIAERIGEADKAKQHYLKAISLAKHPGDAQNNYGTFLCGQGEYKESIRYFLKAVEDPNYLTTAQAYENAGLCATQIPDEKLALEYFDKALEQDPTLYSVLLEQAEVNYRIGNATLAQSELVRYIELASFTPRALSLAMQVEHKLGNEQAVADYANLLTAHFPDATHPILN